MAANGGSTRNHGALDPQVERALRAIGHALQNFEARAAASLAPRRCGVLEFVKAAVPVLAAVVTGMLGYFLYAYGQGALEQQKLETERQRTALDARRVSLSEINAMQPLLTALLGETAPDRREAEAQALLLATFGGISASPLVRILDFGDTNRVLAAENGLRLAAAYDHPAVCDAVEGVLANRTGLYGWRTQLSAIGLVGQLHCPQARAAIEDLQRILEGGIDGYSETIRLAQPREFSDIEHSNLMRAATQTIDILDAVATMSASGDNQ